MAISRGPGTEIIRSASFESCSNVAQELIVGVQHHIYTVLSITAHCQGVTGTEKGYITLVGYDALHLTTPATAQSIDITTVTCGARETFVWNDKFSFNGFEPTDFVGPMDDATKQDAIADQGSSVAQYLEMQKGANGDQFHVHVTYIDQNNA